MNRINISAVSWAWLLPRRGRSGRRLDFYGKHHASSSKMSAAWWQPYQVESASKTNFYIRQNLVNHKVPLRGTCNVQLMDQAANLSEVLAWSFILKSVLRTANIYDVSPDNYKNKIYLIFSHLTSWILQNGVSHCGKHDYAHVRENGCPGGQKSKQIWNKSKTNHISWDLY